VIAERKNAMFMAHEVTTEKSFLVLLPGSEPDSLYLTDSSVLQAVFLSMAIPCAVGGGGHRV
jgi:hypothetical protein